jgi:hypothetical protein
MDWVSESPEHALERFNALLQVDGVPIEVHVAPVDPKYPYGCVAYNSEELEDAVDRSLLASNAEPPSVRCVAHIDTRAEK